MTTCPACTGALTPGARFCVSCGAPVPRPAWPGTQPDTRWDTPGPAAGGTRTWAGRAEEPPSTSWEDGIGAGAARGVRVLAAVTLVVVLALVGSVAWAATRDRDAPLVTTPQPAPSTQQAPTYSAGSARSGATASPRTDPSTDLDATEINDDGPLVVLSGGAAADPDASTVRTLLDRHFTAINAKDYDGWRDTVVPRRAADENRSHWLDGFRTTVDSDVVLSTVASTGSGTAIAYVSFVSTQDPADAPDGVSSRLCWSQELPVSGLRSVPRIGVPATGSTRRPAC